MWNVKFNVTMIISGIDEIMAKKTSVKEIPELGVDKICDDTEVFYAT